MSDACAGEQGERRRIKELSCEWKSGKRKGGGRTVKNRGSDSRMIRYPRGGEGSRTKKRSGKSETNNKKREEEGTGAHFSAL